MNYRYLPEAKDDADETFERYESEQTGVGTRFIKALDVTVERIQRDPESFAFAAPELRSVTLKKFPYSVYYQIEEHEILIVAVAHASRHLGFIRTRLSPE